MPSSILNTLHGHGWGRSSRGSSHGTQANHSARHPSGSSASPSLGPAQSQGSTRGLSPVTSGNSHRSSGSHGNRDPSITLGFRIESPPIMMYGAPQESSGALISGILDLHVLSDPTGTASSFIDVGEASMAVVQEVTYWVPASTASKLGAQTKIEELATWDVLPTSHRFFRGATFGYPFSHLLPGALPPTCRCKLFQVRYYLRASAREVTSGRSVETTMDLMVGRSAVQPGDKTSVRVFPPTDLSLSMVLPTIVYPQSTISAEMRLEGLVGDPDPKNGGRIRRWQVKRVNWRVDETAKVVPPAAANATEEADKDKDVVEDKQTLGAGQHKSGWKTDYQTQKGLMEMVTPDLCPGALSRACKDVADPVSGLYVSHVLVVEVLIAEEVMNSYSSRQGMLTGSARILRMQFSLTITDRSGLGISWDAEVPPTYADIPMSPPNYDSSLNNNLPSFEEIHSMTFSPALSPLPSVTASPLLSHVESNAHASLPTSRLHQLRLTDPSSPSLTATAAAPSPSLQPASSAPPVPGASPRLLPKFKRSS